MIPEKILLLAVAALQLTNTISNILYSIILNKNKISKEMFDALKEELDTKILINKELRADNKQERAQREMMTLQLVAAKRDYFKETGKEWHYVSD